MSNPTERCDSELLDPLTLDLRGSWLIEASAGTGKTWTIAMLYLRLVLGHGGQAPRPPSSILVLTFTDAAAQELRDRIRQRLAQASDLFAALADREAGQSAGPSSGGSAQIDAADPMLLALCREFSPAAWRSCARTLDLAAQAMDEAVIATIHAWCARVLKEHAFASGSLFDQQLETDQAARLLQLVWDYWRAQVAGLPETALADVLAVWPRPDALLPLARRLTRGPVPSVPAESLLQAHERAAACRRAALARIKARWCRDADDLRTWLLALGSDSALRAGDVRRWMEQLKTWAGDPEKEDLDLKTGWKRLSPQGLQERWRGPDPAPTHPLLEALADLPVTLQGVSSIREAIASHAMAWMAHRLQRSLNEDGALGFDGLLTSLDAALRGAGAPQLVRSLRAQFPAVLIDEFQDTDPIQYRIFDQIYQVADNDPGCLLIFIGDPKQAIYGFRGADVQTYLHAARACGDRRRTLARNFRASVPLVAAVNHCFARCPKFPTGVLEENIDFHPVLARGRDEDWVVDGELEVPVTATWIDPVDEGKPLSVEAYRVEASAACAAQIAARLAWGAQGRAGFRSGQGLVPIRPADMAVLVNGREEAESVRQALAGRGIRSVYLSERESVFASPQAAEMATCLVACAQPTQEGAVRAALATPLLGVAFSTLDALIDDERAWDEQVERFEDYQRIWQRRGVLPMLRQLFQDFAVPARCFMDSEGGERRLTDCLHLAELLQQASDHLDGPQALLRYVQQQCAEPEGDDDRRRRLESDEVLVRVITIHKSKGLEYPLVFLPFACYAHSTRTLQGPQWLDEGGVKTWVIEPDRHQQAQLARERLGEEVRKLYVALTRAQHAVWLGLGALRATAQSGLGHVLGQDVRRAWQALVDEAPELFGWAPAAPAIDGDVRRDAVVVGADRQSLGPARTLVAPVVRDPWWIASYSALQRHAENRAGGPINDLAAPETPAEDVLSETRPRLQQPEDSQALADFPRGGEAGTFLHGLLEWAARRHFRDLADVRDMIARRCVVRGWEVHIDSLCHWLSRYCQTAWRPDLPGQPVVRLDQTAACVPEMEFWFPVQHLDVAQLDRVMTRAFFGTVSRPALARGVLNGLFKGFIDLVMQVDGRYYLMDYKSNDLGPSISDYDREHLVSAMCHARYDVQLMVYCLALHRLLRARLPDYDYDRHMGGAIYHFLRGERAPGQGLLAWRPPRALIQSLDALVRADADRATHLQEPGR